MPVTYTINHSISSELETWLSEQPEFVSFEQQDNGNKILVVYNHADVAAETAFKALLAKQMGLQGENVNVSDSDIASTIRTNTFTETTTPITIVSDDITGQLRIKPATTGFGDVINFALFNTTPAYFSAGTIEFTTYVDTPAAESTIMTILVKTGGIHKPALIATSEYLAIGDGSFLTLKNTGLTQYNEYTFPDVTTKMIGENSPTVGFFGQTPVTQPAANADTSGATLGQLETEVNELKALLRSLGLMAT